MQTSSVLKRYSRRNVRPTRCSSFKGAPLVVKTEGWQGLLVRGVGTEGCCAASLVHLELTLVAAPLPHHHATSTSLQITPPRLTGQQTSR
eukprot:562322-Pyramimonas_sp.AAC.1